MAVLLQVHALHPGGLGLQPGAEVGPGRVQAEVGRHVIGVGLHYHVLRHGQPDVAEESRRPDYKEGDPGGLQLGGQEAESLVRAAASDHEGEGLEIVRVRVQNVLNCVLTTLTSHLNI